MSNESVITYARTFLGTPYLYGGNNRLVGFDCSGFVCEILKSFGLVGIREDFSADTLFDKFKAEGIFLGDRGTKFPKATLLFFGPKAINHISISVDKYRMIESGGGDMFTKSFVTAQERGAMVRERMITSRKDFIAAIIPPWPEVD